MNMVLYMDRGRGMPQDMVLLADEMKEDPHCHLVAIGADDAGAVLVTLWDEGPIAEEVAASLADLGGTVRRLSVPEGLLSW